MADALCGPSNALQSFQKHAAVDRTLQQDRITTHQAPAESFRSAPGPNAGVLDAEFEAFQAGHPLQTGYPESGLFEPGVSTNPFQQNNSQTQLPSWASDFQNTNLNEARMTPIPQSQFLQHAPPQRTGRWHQEYLRQQNHPSYFQDQQQQASAGQKYNGWSYGYTNGLLPHHHDASSPMALRNQPEKQAEKVFYEEAAFESAFNAAKQEVQQSEDDARQQEIQIDTGIRIGSDRITDEAKKREEEGRGVDDAEELAKTAGQLLENMKDEQSRKFQDSNFLSLMRQLRDKEVRLEGNGLVDADNPSSTSQSEDIEMSQPLHPGGNGYPTVPHADPDEVIVDQFSQPDQPRSMII